MTSNIEKRLAALEAQLGEREKMIPLIFPDWALSWLAHGGGPRRAPGYGWLRLDFPVLLGEVLGGTRRVAGGTRPATGGPSVSTSQPVGGDGQRLAPAARTGGPGDGAECLRPSPRSQERLPTGRSSRPNLKTVWWIYWPRPWWPS